MSLNEKKLLPKLRLFFYKQNFINTEQASTRCAKPFPNQTQKTNSTPRIQLQRYTAGINNKITNSSYITLQQHRNFTRGRSRSRHREVSRQVKMLWRESQRFWKYFYSQISPIIDSKLSQDYINSKDPLLFSPFRQVTLHPFRSNVCILYKMQNSHWKYKNKRCWHHQKIWTDLINILYYHASWFLYNNQTQHSMSPWYKYP